MAPAVASPGKARISWLLGTLYTLPKPGETPSFKPDPWPSPCALPQDLGSVTCSAGLSPQCSRDMGPGGMLGVRQMGPDGSRGTPVTCFTLGLSFVNRNLRDKRPALALLPAEGFSLTWKQREEPAGEECRAGSLLGVWSACPPGPRKQQATEAKRL